MTSITVVDNLEVSEEQIEQAIQLYDLFEPFIASQKGFISAKLVQAHDTASKFNIVIISEWENKESFEAAISSPGHANVGSTEVEFPRHRASYHTVRRV